MFQDVVGLSNLKLNHSVAIAHDLEILVGGYYKIAEQEFTVTQTGSSKGLDFGYVIGINSSAISMEVKYTLYQEFYVEQNYMNTALALVSLGLSKYVNVPTVVKEFMEEFVLGNKAYF